MVKKQVLYVFTLLCYCYQSSLLIVQRDIPIIICHSMLQIFANLVELNLSRNQLISFPFHIFPCCPKLESLDLSDNLIQEKQRHLSHSVSTKIFLRKIAQALQPVLPQNYVFLINRSRY